MLVQGTQQLRFRWKLSRIPIGETHWPSIIQEHTLGKAIFDVSTQMPGLQRVPLRSTVLTFTTHEPWRARELT